MNNKGVQLAINMVVVIILGIAMLGVGTTIFYSAFQKTNELKDNVDSQTQARINDLLDDGSIVSIPVNTMSIDRGDMATFSMGITNINTVETNFKLYVTYAGSSAYPENDPFNPRRTYEDMFNTFTTAGITCPGAGFSSCGDEWVRMTPSVFEFSLNPNEKNYPLFGIEIPKDTAVLDGQYIFNVDICIPDYNGDCEFVCPASANGVYTDCKLTDESRYDSRQQVIITI